MYPIDVASGTICFGFFCLSVHSCMHACVQPGESIPDQLAVDFWWSLKWTEITLCAAFGFLKLILCSVSEVA